MADMTPGEANVRREGPQLDIREAQRVAAESGTVRGPAGQGSADRDVLDPAARGDARAADDPSDRAVAAGTGNDRPSERAPDDRPFANSEAALGGADSVQKTTWGVGHGGEPVGTEEHAPVNLRKGEGDVVSRVSPGGGVSPVAWIVGILAVLALAVYGFGAFRG